MPKDNIERAIAKGTGEGGDADAMETVVYEGYGPGGVALLVETVTDNRNRTGADVRHLFTKFGGSLGEPGSVAYLFDKKGVIVVDAARYDEDDLLAAVEAGAEDISSDEDVFEVVAELADFTAVRRALEEAGVEIESAELTYRPSSARADQTRGRSCKLMRLIEALEENDDVERRARQLRRTRRACSSGSDSGPLRRPARSSVPTRRRGWLRLSGIMHAACHRPARAARRSRSSAAGAGPACRSTRARCPSRWSRSGGCRSCGT